MSLYIILVPYGDGWTPAFTLFETRKAAEEFALEHYAGKRWRLILVPAALLGEAPP